MFRVFRLVLIGMASIVFVSTNIGCSRTELISYREAVNAGLSTQSEEHLKWSQIIAGDTNGDGVVDTSDGAVDLSKLPNLSNATVPQRNAFLSGRKLVHDEYRKTYEESKAQDSAGKGFNFFGLFGSNK